MDVQVYNKFNSKIASVWRNFEVNASLLPFQSYEWQKYWYDQVGRLEYKISICIIVVSVDSQVRAIFPLGIKKAYCAKVLEFIGGDQADYSAPLVAHDMDAEEFSKIWIRILKEIPDHDVVFFRNMPRYIHKNYNFLLKNLNAKKVGSSFSAKLHNSVDVHFSTLSKRMLKDNKRMIKKLSKMGELRFRVLENYTDFNTTLQIAICQKSKRYDSTDSNNILNKKSVKRFIENIYSLKKSGINIHFSILELDEVILATHIGILYQDVFYYLLPTFNQDIKWRKYSLGRIHLEKLTEWAIIHKVNNFDFTIGAESYKKIWCNNEMDIYRHLRIRSFRGTLYFIMDLLIEFVKANTYLKRFTIRLINFHHKIRRD